MTDRALAPIPLAERIFEVALSLVLSILSAPLLAAIAVAIRLEGGGPVFYRQIRVGRSGRRFRMIKFRTMRVDAEREVGPVWSARSDGRTTRVGRLLRPTHLDELPQLWHVFRGEMGLVGPRPERPEFVETLQETIQRYHHRHVIRPGITGLAQVRGRYDDSIGSVRRKTRYDLYYIRHRSLALDLWILGATAGALFARPEAAAVPQFDGGAAPLVGPRRIPGAMTADRG